MGITLLEANAFLRKIRLMKGVDDPDGFHYDLVKDLSNGLIL